MSDNSASRSKQPSLLGFVQVGESKRRKMAEGGGSNAGGGSAAAGKVTKFSNGFKLTTTNLALVCESRRSDVQVTPYCF